MANQARSKVELDEAREELARVNEQLGYRHNLPTPQIDGGPEHGPGQTTEALPPAAPEPQVDPGPPRFLGVDVEHGVAGLAGGAFIPISPSATSAIVDVLLGELREHLDRTLALVRATHASKANPAQVAIEFPDGPRDPS